jgi:hypothetical protein
MRNLGHWFLGRGAGKNRTKHNGPQTHHQVCDLHDPMELTHQNLRLAKAKADRDQPPNERCCNKTTACTISKGEKGKSPKSKYDADAERNVRRDKARQRTSPEGKAQYQRSNAAEFHEVV